MADSESDKLFRAEGYSRPVKIEGDSIASPANAIANPKSQQLDKQGSGKGDLESQNLNSQQATALAELNLMLDIDQPSEASESAMFNELFNQRIAKVRRVTADISKQIDDISPPSIDETDIPEKL
jgi:hypothetical protein